MGHSLPNLIAFWLRAVVLQVADVVNHPALIITREIEW